MIPTHMSELPEPERQRYIAQAAALGREAEQWKARALAAEAALGRQDARQEWFNRLNSRTRRLRGFKVDL